MKSNVYDLIETPQDIKALILDVRKYARLYLHNGVKKRASVANSEELAVISQAAGQLISELASDNGLSQIDLDNLIAELETVATQSPVARLTLAAPPSSALKKKLVDWCREHISAEILIDFQFSASILGGIVVQYGSHVHDWSFRRQILASRSKFAETLHRV